MNPAPISCIITSYNNARTLPLAVESVLRQSLPVAEIIIADDGSSDGSQALIATLARRHACIQPILRERNLGVAANRDLAIRAASCPFITHLDGDDLFAPGKIVAEWEALNARTDAVAFSMTARIRPQRFWQYQLLDPQRTVTGSPRAVVSNLLARSGPIPRDMLLSKTLFEQAGGFTHGVEMYEDWQFKLRLAALGVPWLPSRSIGTLYIQHGIGLSAAATDRHDLWKRRVVQDLEPLLVERLGLGNIRDLAPVVRSAGKWWPTRLGGLRNRYRALTYQSALNGVRDLIAKIEG